MYLTSDQAASLKAQINTLRNSVSRISRMVMDLELEIQMLDRSFSMANHPAGKAREPQPAQVLPFVIPSKENN